MDLEHQGRCRCEVSSTVARIIFSSNGYVVAALRDTVDGSEACVRGSDPYAEIEVGTQYRFMGTWVRHQKYGLQFSFSTFCVDVPADLGGLQIYLEKKADGIGYTLARRLVDRFGANVIEAIIHTPDIVTQSGILSEMQVKRAAASLQTEEATRKTKVELFAMLNGQGFLRQTIERCISLWGASAPQRIRANPFCLLEARIAGCGFKKVDDLYRKFNLPLDNPRRQMYAAWHSVISARDGHTWLPLHEVVTAIKDCIGPGAAPAQAIREAEHSHLLALKEVNSQHYVADFWRAEHESQVVAQILNLMAYPKVRWPDPAKLPRLHEYQRAKLASAFTSTVCILAGSPGTGKSFTLAAVAAALVASGYKVGVCAPTGKASVRITEFLRDNMVHLSAVTMHSLLGVQSSEGGALGFKYNHTNPLPYDYILADEMSMLDTDLAAHFFRACSPGTHILLVGDPYQLPPVGHGAVLRDLLLAGIPRGELTEIQRNSGAVVQACKDIKERRKFTAFRRFNLPEENLVHMECRTQEAVVAQLRQFLRKVLAGTKSCLDPIDDVQVLTILNDHSPLSRKALNGVIQAEVNPNGVCVEGNPYRVGDKIICLSNGWHFAVQPSIEWAGTNPVEAEKWVNVLDNSDKFNDKTSLKFYVANGDLGRVLAVGPREMVAAFSSRRIVRLRLASQDGDDEADFDLGYCITIHKSQGSSSRAIIFIADPDRRASRIGCRELVFTAFSRTETMCLSLGKRTTIDNWCMKESIFMRRTMLRDMLADQLVPAHVGPLIDLSDLED